MKQALLFLVLLIQAYGFGQTESPYFRLVDHDHFYSNYPNVIQFNTDICPSDSLIILTTGATLQVRDSGYYIISSGSYDSFKLDVYCQNKGTVTRLFEEQFKLHEKPYDLDPLASFDPPYKPLSARPKWEDLPRKHYSDSLVDIFMVKQLDLYRGFDNKVFVRTIAESDQILLTTQNATATYDQTLGCYNLRPGAGRICRLIASIIHDGDTIHTALHTYNVKNLPNPIVYWGGSKEIAIIHAPLSARLDYQYFIKPEYTVISWTIIYENEIIRGEGPEMTKAESFLEKLPKNSEINLTTLVRGQDGIARKIDQVFKVNPND